MKASESNPNYPSKVREMTNYTIREIKKVCKDIGPRPSGEENERKAQDYVADSMSKVADSVVKEKFDGLGAARCNSYDDLDSFNSFELL